MRRPLIEGEDFEACIGQGEQIQGKDLEAYQGRGSFLGQGKEKEEKERVRKRLVLMCGKGVVHEKDVCKK
jgi:hypothetical protein